MGAGKETGDLLLNKTTAHNPIYLIEENGLLKRNVHSALEIPHPLKPPEVLVCHGDSLTATLAQFIKVRHIKRCPTQAQRTGVYVYIHMLSEKCLSQL